MQLEVGVAVRALPLEPVSGDVARVDERPHETWVLLADGLGHGEEAHLAASRFCEAFLESAGESLPARFADADGALRNLRGAAGAALRFERAAARLSLMSVGDALLLHTDGLSSRFDARQIAGVPAQAAADLLLEAHARPTDDAACVVVRVVAA
jgi:hypothetical protein